MTMAREPVPDDGPTYEELKALAEAEGRPVDSMYALSRANDPFVADMPRRQGEAEWFARFWQEFTTEQGSKLHIRRIHYRLISQTRPSGPGRGMKLWPGSAIVDRKSFNLTHQKKTSA